MITVATVITVPRPNPGVGVGVTFHCAEGRRPEAKAQVLGNHIDSKVLAIHIEVLAAHDEDPAATPLSTLTPTRRRQTMQGYYMHSLGGRRRR